MSVSNLSYYYFSMFNYNIHRSVGVNEDSINGGVILLTIDLVTAAAEGGIDTERGRQRRINNNDAT